MFCYGHVVLCIALFFFYIYGGWWSRRGYNGRMVGIRGLYYYDV